MAKKGKATNRSIKHGVEGSEQWIEDRKHFDQRKKIKWIPVEASKEMSFESDTSALRPLGASGPVADFGYMASESWDSNLEDVGSKNFHDRMQAHRLKFSYYDHVYERKDKQGNRYQAVRKIKAGKDASFVQRNTFDLTPFLSKALEHDLQDQKKISILRHEIQKLLPEAAKSYENIFKGSKVVGVGVHCQSGQFHLDFWTHDFEEQEVETGKKKRKLTVQSRKVGSLCHYGSGSGIVALKRHINVLGQKASTVCPETVEEVERAIAGKATRSVERGREDDANRDIRMHEVMDDLFAGIVSRGNLDKARQEYQEYLSKMYSNGLAGPRKYRDQIQARADMELKSIEAEKAKVESSRKNLENRKSLIEDQDVTNTIELILSHVDLEESKAEFQRNCDLAVAQTLAGMMQVRRPTDITDKQFIKGIQKTASKRLSKGKSVEQSTGLLEELFELLGGLKHRKKDSFVALLSSFLDEDSGASTPGKKIT